MATKLERFVWLLSQMKWHDKRALDNYEIHDVWAWHAKQAIWYERQIMRLHDGVSG